MYCFIELFLIFGEPGGLILAAAVQFLFSIRGAKVVNYLNDITLWGGISA
jgi:hypothetical protein